MKKLLIGSRVVMLLWFTLCPAEARTDSPELNDIGYIFPYEIEQGMSEDIKFQYKVIEPYDYNDDTQKWKGKVSLVGLEEGQHISSSGIVDVTSFVYDPVERNHKGDYKYHVVAIEKNAFKECVEIEEILFSTWEDVSYYEYSSGITSIGDSAFFLSSNLEKISWYFDKDKNGCQDANEPEHQDSFPPSLKAIGKHAFKNTPLTGNITIGDSVKTIAAGAFDNTKITGLTIKWEGEGSMEIAAEAFANCADLKKLTITSEGGGSVTLAKDAFLACVKLDTIILGAAVKVSAGAFPNSDALQRVIVTAGGVSFEVGAFDGCNDLEGIEYEGEEEGIPTLEGSLSEVFGGIPASCEVNVSGWNWSLPKLAIQYEELPFTDVNVNATLRTGLVVGEETDPVYTGVTWRELKPQEDLNRPNAIVLKPFQTETDGGVVVYPLYNGTVETTDIEAKYGDGEDAIYDTVTVTIPIVTVEPETPEDQHPFVNQSLSLTAVAKQGDTPFTPNAWRWEATGEITFTNNENIANVTFTGPCEATITATAIRQIDSESFPGPSHTWSFTVPIPDTTVTGITATVNEVIVSTTSMKKKETITLTANVTVDGVSVPSLDEGTLTWTVNEDYFECDYVSGNVISLTPKQYLPEDQTFTIQAKHKNDTPETFSLTLLKPEITVSVSTQQGSTLSLNVGDTRNLNAVVSFDGDAVQNDVATLDWHSSDEAIVSFDNESDRSAVIKALAAGTVNVWASLPNWNDTKSNELSVAVSPVHIPDTTVTGVTATATAIKTKETITVTATVTIDEVPASTFVEGTLIWTVPEAFDWSYVDSKGNVITLTPKQYVTTNQTFSIQAKHKSDDTPETFSLTLLKPEISVSVSTQQGSTLSLNVGDTRNLNAVVSFDGDAVQNDVATLTWHSSDEAVVSFENESDRSAVIKALTVGTANVWASLPNWNDTKSNELSVAVSPVHIPDTTVTGVTATATAIKTKETITVTAAVTIDEVPASTFAEGMLTWIVPEAFDWSYVDSKGNVISLTPKQYVTTDQTFTIGVKHKSDDDPETFSLTLLKPEISVSVSTQQGSTLSLNVGDTRNLNAVVSFDGDAVQNDVATLDWHSSDEAIVSFDNESDRSAVIKALTAGTANVWASLPNWNDTKSNELSVAVSPIHIPDTTVTGVSATSASMKTKETVFLTAAVTIDEVPASTFAEGTLTWTVPEAFDWSYVDSKGNVIALTPKQYVTEDQTFSIQAKHKSDDTPETFSLTLLKPEIAVSVSTQQGSTLSLNVGDTRNLNAVVSFDGDAVQNDVATLTWHSSDEAIVSFENESDRSAVIKALTAGTANVWASLPNWNGTKSNELSVAVSPIHIPDTTVTGITATSASMKTKETITVTATVTIDEVPASLFAEGTLIWTVPEAFDWSYVDSKGNVITLTPKQYVTANQTFTIQAKHKSDDDPETFSLTLLKPEISVSVQQGSTLSLNVGDTRNLNAVVSFDGDAVQNDVATLTWHSSDEAIVSFENESDRSAVIKALTAGTANVWASLPNWNDTKSNELSVAVSPVHIPDTTVTGVTATATAIKTKETITVTANVTIDEVPASLFAEGTLIWTVPEAFDWSYVDSKGNVISLTPKQYLSANQTFTIQAKHKSDDDPETFSLTLLKPEISVSVSTQQGSTLSLNVGDTRNLNAVVSFDGDAVQNDVATLTWHSSDEAIVFFENESDRSAVIKALTAGTANVWASLPAWSNKESNKLSVIVSPAPQAPPEDTPEEVRPPVYPEEDFIVPDNAQLVILASTDIARNDMPLQLSVAFLLNGDTLRVTPEQFDAAGVRVEWESLDLEYSNDNFIEVDDNGLVLVAEGRQTGDCAQIVARIEAMGRVLADTFTVYVERHPPMGMEAIPEIASRTVMLHTDGLYMTGFAPTDRVTVYTIDGRILLRLPASIGFAPHPFHPHTLYIIHTPEAVFKRMTQP